MNKLTLSTIIAVVLFSATASAEYMIKIPLEQANGGFLPNNTIVFTGGSSNPVDPEVPVDETPVANEQHICEIAASEIQQYASSIGVNITVDTGYSGSLCNVDIRGIYSFSTIEQLQNVGDYILGIPVDKSSVVYGFADGGGQPLIWNGAVYTNMWYDR